VRITIVTDGGCSVNKRILKCPGAYAFIVFAGDPNDESLICEYSQIIHDTTNNRMELLAAIMGLSRSADEMLKKEVKPSELEINVISDSRYLVDGYHEYLPDWKLSGWRKADRSPVKNLDLWKMLNDLAPEFKSLTFTWVKGHANDRWNERADQMVGALLYPSRNQGNASAGSRNSDAATAVEITSVEPDDPVLQDIQAE